MKLFSQTEITNHAYNMDKALTGNVESVTDLQPLNSSQKSFYGKAQVISLDNSTKVLQSYDTFVAAVLPDGQYVQNGRYSATTGKHEQEFSLQFAGVPADNEKTLGKPFYREAYLLY